MSQPAPDLVEPVDAWRAWNPRREFLDTIDVGLPPYAHAVGYRLRPVGGFRTADPVWYPRKRAEASCLGLRRVEQDQIHRAPEEGCFCGLWGFSSLARLLVMRESASLVIGEVALWGKVIVTERGYRAQYGYPRRLIVRENGERSPLMASELAIYGVPVEIRNAREILEMADLW